MQFHKSYLLDFPIFCCYFNLKDIQNNEFKEDDITLLHEWIILHIWTSASENQKDVIRLLYLRFFFFFYFKVPSKIIYFKIRILLN